MSFIEENFQPGQVPLFRAAQLQIMHELNLLGVLGADAPEQALWSFVFRNAPWRFKGMRCVINRFMGARRRAKEEVGVWHTRGFRYTLACLELDFFQNLGTFERIANTDKLVGEDDGAS